jgi:hypothetical protein
MVTGHGKLQLYLHRFGLTDDPMCLCEEEETKKEEEEEEKKKKKKKTNERKNELQTT